MGESLDGSSPTLQSDELLWKAALMNSGYYQCLLNWQMELQYWNTCTAFSSCALLLRTTLSTFVWMSRVDLVPLCLGKAKHCYCLQCSLRYTRYISQPTQQLSRLLKQDWSYTQKKWLNQNYLSHISTTVWLLWLFHMDYTLFLDSCR